MCLICENLLEQRMTLFEAKKAAIEINYTRQGSDHVAELEEAISKMDLEMLDRVLEYGTDKI